MAKLYFDFTEKTTKMKSKNLIRTSIIFLIVLLNVGCDQLSKEVVREHIEANEVIHVVDNHFILKKVENKGAALSSFANLPKFPKMILLQLLPILVLLYMLRMIIIKTKLPPLLVLGMCFVIGGGIGNILDRMLYGSVTDFMYLHFGFLRTGIFNMADVSVVIGTLLALLVILTNPNWELAFKASPKSES